MIFPKWFGRSVMAAAILGILPLAGADGPNGVADPGMLARTIPSHTAKPSFMEVGIVRQWLVKPDDVVKKGQLLGREDTDLEALQLRSLRIQADSTAAIEAATADRDARKVEYENKQKSLAGGGASESEVLEAKLDFQQKEAVLRNSMAQREKLLADVDIQARKIDKMQLLSPVDGTVKEISIQEGEVVDPNKPDGALTLVTNDPLWVEVKVPSAQGLKLKLGDAALVEYQTQPGVWLKGTVIYLDPEVDAASDKQTVRLEMSNDAGTPSGLWVRVRFPSGADGH
ncbi:MAG: efflux RND transporter periplasmic adaptor subunit [Tepidisphaeraceae bacterium]